MWVLFRLQTNQRSLHNKWGVQVGNWHKYLYLKVGIFKTINKSTKYSDLLLSIIVFMLCSQTEAWAGNIWQFIAMQTTGSIN